jgi:hypothetical protein
MARRTRNAAEYLSEHSTTVSLILGELAESAGVALRAWNLAVEEVRRSPERALSHLTEAEVRLDNHARLEVRDSLRSIRRAVDLLDHELPDEARAEPSA